MPIHTLNAVKGNQRAQRLFTELVGTTERDNKRLHDEWLDVATTYKLEWDKELDRRKQLGITGPEPLPHPDDVVINYRTGDVRIKGPMSKEDKAQIDLWLARKADFEAELKEWQGRPATLPQSQTARLHRTGDRPHQKGAGCDQALGAGLGCKASFCPPRMLSA